MLLTFLVTGLSFLITFWKTEIGLSFLFLGILFPIQAGHLTSNIGIITGTLLAGTLSFLRQREKNLSPDLKFLLPALIGFIILGLFSQHHSTDLFPEDVARQSFVSFRWFIFHFLIVFAVLFNLQKIDQFYRVMNFYKAMYFLVLILALAQSLKAFNLLNIGEYPYFINEGMGEVYGIFRGGGPNVLVAFIFMIFPLIFSHNVYKKGTIFSTENIIFTVLTLIIFLFTSSRAGYLALALLFPLITLAFSSKRKFLQIYIFSALPFLAVSYLLTFYLFQHVEISRAQPLKQDDSWECYLINENHKIRQIIRPSPTSLNGRLYLYLAGGKGEAYQLILKVDGKIVKVFKDELEPTPRWYEVAISEQMFRNKKEIIASLEVNGKLEAKNNYVVVYGGKNPSQERVTSYLYDGIKWSDQDLSLRSGVQRGVYYLFFKGNGEDQKETAGRLLAGDKSWDIVVNNNKYKIEQIISLKERIKEKQDIYLNLAGGAGKNYRVRVSVEGKLVEELGPLENNPKWYRVRVPEGILEGKEKLKIILEGTGQLDSNKNWFLVKGSSGTGPDIKSAFYDGSSWQDYDLSPEKGLQSGVYHIFLGQNRGCCPGQEEKVEVWDCLITDNRYKIKQIISIDEEEKETDLYLELAGGSGPSYGLKILAEGKVIAQYNHLNKVPYWYKVRLPAALSKNKKEIEIIVEGTGKLDARENWFMLRGGLVEGAPVKSLFYDGVSWQSYDLSPDEGLQRGAYHIFLGGQTPSPKAVSPGGFSPNWDMFLADPHHKVLQKILLPKERDRGKLYLLLSGAMGDNYGFRIRVDGKIIKTFEHKISVHPRWYELQIPEDLLTGKDFINVELEAFGKLDQGENWVKIYGNDYPAAENIKSFLFDGNKWIDFDLSIREGIQGGAYHIYLDSPSSVYSTYAIPIVTELFNNGNKIKQVFQLDKGSLNRYKDLIINLAGGPGKDYQLNIIANGLLVKNFPRGLPTERDWYKIPLPKNLTLKKNRLEVVLELVKDNKKDIIKNRVVVGAGLPYQNQDIKSFLDITGNWEEVGHSPISNMPKNLYQIFLLDAKNNVINPPLLSLDKSDIARLSQKELTKGWLDNLFRYFTEKDQTSHDRILMWSLCWDIIKDHPLLGVGYYTFPIIYPQYYKKYKDFLPQIYTHPHNDYLAMGIGFGIAGMFLFALWYLLPLKTSLKLCLNPSQDPMSRHALALVSIYLSLFVLSLFYMNFADERLYGTFWLIVGLTYFLDNCRTSS